MRNRRKQISFLSVCLLSLLLAVPLTAAAEEGSDNNGEMELKMNRIGEDNTQHYQHTETEMEKRFPELFDEETRETIEAKQTETESSIQELEASLFTMDIDDADTELEDTKQALFTEDYTAPQTAADSNQHEEGGAGWSTALYVGFAGLATVLCAGVYALFQRFTG